MTANHLRQQLALRQGMERASALALLDDQVLPTLVVQVPLQRYQQWASQLTEALVLHFACQFALHFVLDQQLHQKANALHHQGLQHFGQGDHKSNLHFRHHYHCSKKR
jgi:hypothetical protein